MIPKPPISIYKKIHLYKKMIPKPSIEINLKQHSTKFPRWGDKGSKNVSRGCGKGEMHMGYMWRPPPNFRKHWSL